ncbi:MAG: acetyl-CoA C-acetyltransferase [Pseudomonadota bacterium]
MPTTKKPNAKNVYLVAGLRTPQLKSKFVPGPFSASDLAVATGSQLLLKMPFAATAIEQVIIGCVIPAATEANIAKQIATRLGCKEQTTAFTVQRNCASGMQAIDTAMNEIRYKKAHLILCGGTEAMSHASLTWHPDWINWLATWQRSHFTQKLQLLTQFKPAFFRPVISLLKGLTDPLNGLSMGQTAELLASQFLVSRTAMDDYALASHQHLDKAQQADIFADEIITLFDQQGHSYNKDNGLKKGSSINNMAKLSPVFDKNYGQVTAANSAQISDGASLLFLASEQAVRKYKLQPLAKLIDCQWQSVRPEIMGIGAAHAIAALLAANDLSLSEIDYWEINEAFAAQVIACLKALKQADYCKNQLAAEQPLGEINPKQLNIDGGGISLGHPVGASGARIVLHLANILKRKKAQRGIASLCIGGGQGGALLLECCR